MARVNGRSPLQMSELTFPLQGPDENHVFSDGVAESLVGKFTDFHGYEAKVKKAELTDDKKVILVTIKVPTKMLEVLGIMSGNERFSL